MLRKNQIITQELQNAPQPLKTKSNFMTPEVKNYAIEEFVRKYHNPKKLCQYNYILSILRESLTGEEIMAKELSKKILEEYESDFLKSIDIEYMIKNCRKYLQNFETDHNYLISIKINQNTCIAEMERYLTLLEKADPNYLNRYYVEYEPNRTGNWQEFERFWQEWKSLNQPPKALLKKMEDELSKRNQELKALPHNMQPQYVLQIVTHIKELEKCIELFKLNREELFQLITKKSWDLTAIYVQIINKCSNLKICLESKEIGDNHSSKLEHIKLPITFIDSKTLEIFCKILENKPFFQIDLAIANMLDKKSIFEENHQELDIAHNSKLILDILCLNMQNKQFQSAYATKNLSCINYFFKNYHDTISTLKEFLAFIERLDKYISNIKNGSLLINHGPDVRKPWWKELSLSKQINQHNKEIFNLSKEQIINYTKGAILAKDTLSQQAEARYHKYLKCIFSIDFFKKNILSIYMASDPDEKQKLYEYAPERLNNALKEIEQTFHTLEVEEEYNIDQKIDQKDDIVMDDTNQINYSHNNTMGNTNNNDGGELE